MGTNIQCGVRSAQGEEHLARTRGESNQVAGERQLERVRGLSQKNKTELRDLCKALSIPLSGHETKPQLARKIKEVQAEREPLRRASLDS